MEPEFKSLPAMTIAGLQAKFATTAEMDKNGVAVIMALWDRFNSRRGEINGQKGPISYGVITSAGGEGSMEYLSGVQIADAGDLPPDMIAIAVPEGQYAVFTHRGPLSKIRETMAAIYGDWVPKNKETLRNAPHLEIYGERFDAHSETSEFEVAVPVK